MPAVLRDLSPTGWALSAVWAVALLALLDPAGCVTCDAGKFSDDGSTPCTDCPAGKTSAAGSDHLADCVACKEFQYAAAGAPKCTDCERGLKAPPGSDGPEDCSGGNLGIILGATAGGLIVVGGAVYYQYKQSKSYVKDHTFTQQPMHPTPGQQSQGVFNSTKKCARCGVAMEGGSKDPNVCSWKEPLLNGPSLAIFSSGGERDIWRCCNCAVKKYYSSTFVWNQKQYDNYACFQCKNRPRDEVASSQQAILQTQFPPTSAVPMMSIPVANMASPTSV